MSSRWFQLDVSAFDAAGVYAAPRSLAELWGTPSSKITGMNKVLQVPWARLDASDRQAKCQSMCRIGASKPPPARDSLST